MELIIDIAATTICLVGAFYFLKAILFGPFIIAQISAEQTSGALNKLKAACYYLHHISEIKKVYIREGKFTFKPVVLVRSTKNSPSPDNE